MLAPRSGRVAEEVLRTTVYMGRNGTVPYGAAHPSIFSTVFAPSSRSSIEEQLSSSKYEKMLCTLSAAKA